jgi:hypothetical protein
MVLFSVFQHPIIIVRELWPKHHLWRWGSLCLGTYFYYCCCTSDATIPCGKADIYHDWLHLRALVAHCRIRSQHSTTEAEKAATPFDVPSPQSSLPFSQGVWKVPCFERAH